jgi:release factor glutamine methyltransferase
MAEKNPRSIEWAWRNLRRGNLHGRALLWHSREPEDIPVKKGSLDLVVSNPPYIPTKDIDGLMREVRREPRMALDGGEEGLKFYRKLLNSVPVLLKDGGALVMEIGDAIQAERMRKAKYSGLVLAEEIPDLSGNTRCMVWERRV